MIRFNPTLCFSVLITLVFVKSAWADESRTVDSWTFERWTVDNSARLSGYGGFYGDDSSQLFDNRQQQLSLRLMSTGSSSDQQHTLTGHLKLRHQTFSSPLVAQGSSESAVDYFRAAKISDNQLWNSCDEVSQGDICFQGGYDLDRLFYRYQPDSGQYRVTLGRLAIYWGTGRFWQPLNLFGSFAPTDLDTDYKAGIDALVGEYYPGYFSAITLAYLPTSHSIREQAIREQAIAKKGADEDSLALHYRTLMESGDEVTLLAGRVMQRSTLGFAWESSFDLTDNLSGIGSRIEAVFYEPDGVLSGSEGETEKRSALMIAGMDYQTQSDNELLDGILINLELYQASNGADKTSELNKVRQSALVKQDIQPQLSEQVIGLGLGKTLSPLWQGNYTGLFSTLSGGASQLHQISAVYSLSDESDLLLSLLSGYGSDASEFGAVPTSLSARLRLYF